MAEKRKSMKIMQIKALGDSEPGGFEGVLSTYGNIDRVGDIVQKGAFDRCLAQNGSKYPFLWQHSSCEPIGSFDVVSTEDALVIKGHFNLDVARGKEGYSLLKAGDVTGLSMGYIPEDWTYDDDGIRILKDVTLIEGSFVTIPANPLAYAEAKSIARQDLAKTPQVKAMSPAMRERLLKAFDEGEDEGEKGDDEMTEDEKKDEISNEDEKTADTEDEDETKTSEDQTEDEDESKADGSDEDVSDEDVNDLLKQVRDLIGKILKD